MEQIRVEISKSELERDYHSMKRGEVVEKYGLGHDANLSKVLKLCGIPPKGVTRKWDFVISE